MPARRTARRNKKPLDVEALWAIKRIGAPTLSPDGRYACAPVTSYDMDKNEGVTELWLFPTGFGAKPAFAKPRKLTAGDKDSDPRWSPDGKWIAFTAKRKDDAEPQVYLIAPDGGEATRLTTIATGALALKWFRDSKRIAFVSWVWPDLATEAAQGKRMKERKEAKVTAHLTERAEYRFWDHWLTDGREPHVLVCDIATGRTHDVLARARVSLQPWEPTSDHYDIAPDGREIALTIDPHGEPGMMNRCDIAVVSLASGRVKNLSSASGMSDEHPRYSPDGRYLAWHAYDTARAFNDQGHLRLYDRRTARLQRLMPQFDRATHHVDWAPDSRALLFLADDRGRIGLWRAALDADLPTPVIRGGTIAGYARSADGGVLAYTRSSARHPPAVFATRGDGSDERAIETLNRAVLARHALGTVREFTFKGWNGEPVQMFVTYPPNFDPAKKWPLMHSIHGGPHAAHQDGWHFRWNAQVFAGQGFVVPQVNYHGSSGFGQKFLETITKRYGEKEFADVEAATDYLLRQGYIDRLRLAATGGSYGGFMVAFMNGHTNRYKAYICHAGCYDWVSMMATDGYRFFAKELGAFHWDDPPRVMRQSPHHYVKSARTPTLVVHGELDYRVPATQALQYYNSLKAKGVAARLVYFPDENHWILKPQNSRLWYAEFFAWLARYAGRGPAAAAAHAKRSGSRAPGPRSRLARRAGTAEQRFSDFLATDAALRRRVGG
ncbi:MAG: S9 family peptidase [Betaproteobacteria bacterium]|nr:MAG: S9 family peptidase [Betaproteobacteria bacterium]